MPAVPPGSAAVVIVTPGAIVIENDCKGELIPEPSLRPTEKLNGLPTAVVGVPLITPEDASSISPGGNDPARLQLNGNVPEADRFAE